MYGVNCCEEDVYSYRGMRSVFEGESPEFEGTELLSRLNLRLLVNQEEKDSMHVYEGQRARILLVVCISYSFLIPPFSVLFF